MPPNAGNDNPVPVAVTRRFNNVAIGQRGDGYLNATAMCKANGKDFYDYERLDTTQGFLQELARSPGIPGDLITKTTTGPNAGRGTWVHPQVAYHLAQWCSPAFAVQVSSWIHDIATKGYATAPGVDLSGIEELIRRTDGIARMLSHKVTTIEKAVPDLLRDFSALSARVNGLLATTDSRGNASQDFISVRQLLDEAGAVQKGRNSINRRIGSALRDLALTKTPPVPLRRCLHSRVWLFPVDFAMEFMASTGNTWAKEHNERTGAQGTLPFEKPKHKRKAEPKDAPASGQAEPTVETPPPANSNTKKPDADSGVA
ncbi:hypothetical protein GAY31_17450 [Azospirillum brasilense]|nr:hypothetical protein [Azospirillum brasilense]